MTTEHAPDAALPRAFVTLAGGPVAGLDPPELLHALVEACADVLGTTAVGLQPEAGTEELHVVVSAGEQADPVAIARLGAADGPCWESVRAGRAVRIPDLDAVGDRWPGFWQSAVQHGLRSMRATPLRLRGEVVGALNLFDTVVAAPNDPDAVAQTASVATAMELFAEDAAHELEPVRSRLEYALTTRIAIEQAKGVLAQASGMSMEDAAVALHAFARENHLELRAVAVSLVNRRIDSTFFSGRPARERRLLAPSGGTSAGR